MQKQYQQLTATERESAGGKEMLAKLQGLPKRNGKCGTEHGQFQDECWKLPALVHLGV